MEPQPLTAEDARAALDTIAASPPFVADPFGVDAFGESMRHLQKLIGSLYLSDPVMFWGVVTGLSALAAGLVVHIVWSLWVLYRSVAHRAETAMEGPGQRDYFAEAQRARAEGKNARAIQLCWFALCTRLAVPLSDTPGRQAKRMARRGEAEKLSTLRLLYERALYSGTSPDDEAVRQVFDLAKDAGLR